MATKKTKVTEASKTEQAVCQTPGSNCDCEKLKKQNAGLKADIAGMEKEIGKLRDEIVQLRHPHSTEDAIGIFSDWPLEQQVDFLRYAKEHLPYTWGAAFGHTEETKEETPAQPTIKERLTAGEDVPVTAENAAEVLEALR